MHSKIIYQGIILVDYTLNILFGYDPCGLTMWSLQFYGNNLGMVMRMSKQSSFLSPSWP